MLTNRKIDICIQNVQVNLILRPKILGNIPTVKIKLNVPLEKQEDDYSCTPVCMKMVLEYIKYNFSSGLPDFDSILIGEAIKTKKGTTVDDGGTTFENIILINEKLKKTRPPLRFSVIAWQKISRIKKELKNDHPVIVGVMMPSPHGDYGHSKVITGIDDEENLVIYSNDPVYGKEEIPLHDFLLMWGKAYKIMIKIEIGEDNQTSIEDWMKNKKTLGSTQQ